MKLNQKITLRETQKNKYYVHHFVTLNEMSRPQQKQHKNK